MSSKASEWLRQLADAVDRGDVEVEAIESELMHGQFLAYPAIPLGRKNPALWETTIRFWSPPSINTASSATENGDSA